MEQTLGANVTNHYRNNREVYNRIQTKLSETKEKFLTGDRDTQITMLQKSHSFAVISVQTPVHIHESAFRKLWSGNDIETALESVNYNNQKVEYIKHSFKNSDMWGHVSDLLESGDIDIAHKYILDNFKGVGPAKAPFVLSMLGFDEKMCIDTNIVNAFGLDGHATTVVVNKYDSLCQSLRDKLPTMRELVTPFVFQWVVFDYQRSEVSTHDVFYDII